jgi:hypothetical protein
MQDTAESWTTERAGDLQEPALLAIGRAEPDRAGQTGSARIGIGGPCDTGRAEPGRRSGPRRAADPVRDPAGNAVRRGHPWVRISLFSGPAGARLIGRTRIRAVHGVATFRGLRLSEAGTYTLTGTSPRLNPDIRNVFTVSWRA